MLMPSRFGLFIIIAISTTLLTAAPFADAQIFQWGKRIGGSSSDFVGGLDTDSAGNIYIAGQFVGTADFNPGPGAVSATSNGLYDVFLVKLDADGVFVWVRTFGGIASDAASSLDVDDDGNIVLAGAYSADTDFDPGPGSAIGTFDGLIDAFVVRFDTDGTFQWLYTLSESGVESCNAVFDSTGDVVVTGQFTVTTDFDAGAGVQNIAPSSGVEAYILKISAAGIFDWVATAPASTYSLGFAIAVDSADDIIVAGEMSGSVDVDPGAGTVLINGPGVIDAFIWKLDTNGNYVWGGTVGGGQLDYGRTVAVDGSDNIIVAGTFQDTADFDPGAGVSNLTSAGDDDAYVLKLDPSGNFVWAESAGDVGEDRAEGLEVDSDSSIWIVGAFNGTVDFDSGLGDSSLTSSGAYNGYIWKLQSDGSFDSVEGLFGPTTVESWRAALHTDEGLIVTGNFRTAMDANPFSGQKLVISAGDADVFVLKFGGVVMGMPLIAWPLFAVHILVFAATVAYSRSRIKCSTSLRGR